MAFRECIPESLKTIIKQNIGFVPLGYRLGKQYSKVKDFLASVQWATEDEIADWQLMRLKQIVEYAYHNVPGYHFLYKKAEVRPSDIRALADIKLLPFVTKEMIRDNLNEFTSRTVPRSRLWYVSTGGSTGIPVGFFRPRLNSPTEDAFMHLGWERAGWRIGDSSAVLRGAFVGSEEKFWGHDRYNQNLLLSSYHLTERMYTEYVKKILEYRPRHLQAYPSAATMLADLILTNRDVGRINFNIILLGSENIYEWQKKKLRAAFPGTRLFGWYGHAEGAILAPMCEYSDHYHIWPYYGLTEMYNETGGEPKQGEVGQLIGTSFWNYATPFIRYRTSDIATMGNFGCQKCLRRFQLLEGIEGRLQEIIVTKSGRYISMTAINMHSDIFDNVQQFQFHQQAPGKVVLNIIKKENYADQDTHKIYSELMIKLGADMELELVFVDMIQKAASGKYRFLKQDLEIKYGE